ncbi:hypothetical protein [Streptomyces sp. NPDC089915]|uniref:hypothetical protein n=1 Tax=Streptomyces sp. NPDC089915 TaxID=3155186 RepID=UPI00342C3311
MSITTRRLAPFLIATTIATGGLALTASAAHAAPARTVTRVTTDGDGDNPFLDVLRKFGNLSRINHDAATGGDTTPPGGGVGQAPTGGDAQPPTGGAGGSGHFPGDGIFQGGIGGDHAADTAPTDVTGASGGGTVHGGESRSGDARPGPIFQR